MKRKFKFCGSLIAIVIVAVCGYWYWINIPPKVEIPTPQMPQPNGYDYFLRAGKAFVPDEKGVDETTDTKFVKGKIYPIADKEAWLQQNAEALRLVREGLRYSVQQPPVRSFSTVIPEYSQFRGIARVLAVQSHVRAERGDWNGAVDSALEGYHLGNEMVRGGPLIGGMVSVAIRSISLRALGNVFPRANVATAKKAATNLEEMYEQRYPYYKAIEDDKWSEVAAYGELMNQKSWRKEVIEMYDMGLRSGSAPPPDRFDSIKVLFYSKRRLIADLEQAADAVIKDAHEPYSKQKPFIRTGSPIADIIGPVLKAERWNWARLDAHTVILMTMYALRAYQLDHGRHPESLQMLTPQYLHKVPIDPFDGINPLQYTVQNDSYKLWSIGPDGVNDNATPILNKDETGRVRHLLLSEDSKGDVVAGVNVP